MARFLTPGWVDEMNAAAASVEIPDEVRLSVGHEIAAGTGEAVQYRFDVEGGRASLTYGTTDGADITLIEDYETAIAIATGALPAQQAVAEGRLKLRGDVGALVRNGPAIAALADVFARVRERTEF